MSIFKLSDDFTEKLVTKVMDGQPITIEISAQMSGSELWVMATSVFLYKERDEVPCKPFWSFWPDNGTGLIPVKSFKGSTEFADLSCVQRAGEPAPYEAQAYLTPLRKYETESLADLVTQLRHDGIKVTIKSDNRTIEKVPFVSTDIKGVKYIL